MTLRRRSLLAGRNSPMRSPARRRTAQTIHRRALVQTVKQMAKPGAAPAVTFGAASKANLKVVVRIRPFNTKEQESNASSIIQVVDEHMMVFDPKQEDDVFFYHGMKQRRDITKRQHKDQKFVFERVFGPDSTNQDVFNNTTKDIIDTLLQGYNCSVFAYGATGAGKTFTMVGRPECPGITLLTLMELYDRIKAIEEEDAGNTIEVAVSYLEVYNEMVRDLLQPGKPLQVQEAGSQVMVPGLSFHEPRDAEHLMSLLALGNCNRSQHPTDANAESSRSHAVFQVLVKQQRARAGVSQSSVSVAKLSMIDLAGSERGAATGCQGARFREGANINRSLLALGNCINALADGKGHIPYRDSKLTRLLKDSLGGNCRSVMVAAVSSASTTFEDTFNTLRYSNRAKTIKTTLKKNQMSVENHVSAYVKIVEALKVELQQSEAREREQVQQAAEYEETIADLRRQLKEAREANLPRITETPTPDSSTLAEDLASSSVNNTSEVHATKSDVAVCAANTTSDGATSPPAGAALTSAVCCRCSSSLAPEPAATGGDLVLEEDLRTAVAQVSGLHREALELASCERELELKLHVTRLKKARLAIVAFAAYKLAKSVSKLERTESQLQERLQQTRGRRAAVESRLAAARDRYSSLATAAQGRTAFKDLLEAAQREECERVLVQQSSGLRVLVTECVGEVQEGHALHCSLLWAVRGLHVHLHSSAGHTEQTQALFQSVVTNLDEFRIAWADQVPSTTGFAEGEEAEGEPRQASPPPTLDVAWLTQLATADSQHQLPSTPGAGKQALQPSTLRKSIMKGSTSTVSLEDRHTSPLSVHGIPESTEQLRQSTLANTISNKLLSSSTSLHNPACSVTLKSADPSGRPPSKLTPHKASFSALTPNKSPVVTLAELVSTQDVTTTVSSMSQGLPHSVSMTVTTKTIVSDSSALESPVLSASSTATLAAQKHTTSSNLESFDDSPILFTRLRNIDTDHHRVSSSILSSADIKTPVHSFPPPIIEEMSPPEMPSLTQRVLPGSYCVDAVMRDASCFDYTSSASHSGERNGGERIHQEQGTGAESSKKTSMQRQSATRNLIARTTPSPLPLLEDGPDTHSTNDLNSTHIISQSSPPRSKDSSSSNGILPASAADGHPLLGGGFVSMMSDAPLSTAAMGRPGSRSAIYDPHYYLSLSPALTNMLDGKELTSQATSLLTAGFNNRVGGACLPQATSSSTLINPSFSTYNNHNNNSSAVNTNHYSNCNLNTTIDIPSSGMPYPSADLNSTVCLETRSAPASSVKLMNTSPSSSMSMDYTSSANGATITKSQPPADATSRKEESALNSTYTANEYNTSPEELPAGQDGAKRHHSARQLMFNSPHQSEQMPNPQNSTFCVDPSEAASSSNTGSSGGSGALLGTNPMKLLEVVPDAAERMAPPPKTQPKLKSILKNSQSNLGTGASSSSLTPSKRPWSNSSSSSSIAGGSRPLGRSQSVKNVSGGAMRKQQSALRPGFPPTDRTGAIRRAMSFKPRHFNGGPTSTATTANQENLPPASAGGRGGASKPLSASVSCINLAAGGGAARAALAPAASVGNLLAVQVKAGGGGGSSSSTTKHSGVGVTTSASSWRP